MRDADRLAHDLIEIDEDLASQEIVHFVLPRGVLAHQPLERGRFVRRVVIDVQVRPLAKARMDEVDEPLEGELLFLAGQGLKGAEGLLSGLARTDIGSTGATTRTGHHAEQILETARGLEVRDRPPCRRRCRRPTARAADESRCARRAAAGRSDAAGLPMAGLQRGLMPQPLQRRRPDADAPRRIERAELRDGLNTGLVQPLHLLAADAGDQAQMIVGVPPLPRSSLVYRTGCSAPPDRDRSERSDAAALEEAPADARGSRRRNRDSATAPAARCRGRRPSSGVSPAGSRELLGVETELQDEVRLARARAWCPMPRSSTRPARRRVDAHEEVADAVPVAVHEHALIDDVRARSASRRPSVRASVGQSRSSPDASI